MTVEVRDSGGVLLGHMRIEDATWLLRPVVRFAHAMDYRYYGRGLRELPDEYAADPSFQTADFKVDKWSTMPTIGKHGGYYPGRVDFCLRWDGPVEALRDISAFSAEVRR